VIARHGLALDKKGQKLRGFGPAVATRLGKGCRFSDGGGVKFVDLVIGGISN
jgi:hypothetical protein